MADPPPYPDFDTSVEPDRSTTGVSRWQMVVGIIGLVLILGLGILMFGPGPGGGGRGPGQNAPVENQEQQIDEDGGGHVPPAGVPDH